MAPVKRAAGTLKETAEMIAAGALSQPRVTGSGSSLRFGNPWPEWQVLIRVRCTSWRVALEKTVLALPRQEKGLPDVLKFAWARRGNPSTGGLINHPRPSPADFARAFPIAPANYTAMASPPGAQSVSELQRAQSCAKKH